MIPPAKIADVFSIKTITMFCKLLSVKYRQLVYGADAVTDDPKASP